MRKKILVCVLTGAMLAMMVAGCGNGETNTDITPTSTIVPTTEPTAESTPEPTAEPTPEPTAEPTTEPTAEPTAEPTETVKAEVVLGEYLGLTLTNITQETLEEEIALVLADYITYQVVDRAAQNGDAVNINYVGTLDGVAFEGGTDDSEEGYDLVLGSGAFIEGFEEGLVGAVAGEVRELTLTFPEDYQSTDLAGQTTVFTVTVNSVKEGIVPELTDEFVSVNLYEGMTAEEFRQTAYEALNEDSLYGQVLLHLMETSELVSYSEAELQEETDAMIEYYTLYADYYGYYLGMDRETMLLHLFGFESEAAMQEYAREYSLYTLKTNYVIAEVASNENILITEEIYNKCGLEYALEHGYEDIASFEADYGADEIKGVILYDLVMDYIISNATVVDAE